MSFWILDFGFWTDAEGQDRDHDVAAARSWNESEGVFPRFASIQNPKSKIQNRMHNVHMAGLQ
jgi:hypothetical protein